MNLRRRVMTEPKISEEDVQKVTKIAEELQRLGMPKVMAVELACRRVTGIIMARENADAFDKALIEEQTRIDNRARLRRAEQEQKEAEQRRGKPTLKASLGELLKAGQNKNICGDDLSKMTKPKERK